MNSEVRMHDPFEQSLRELLNTAPSDHDDDACLGRVLKTANRQVGAGEMFSLIGHWFGATMLAVSKGSPHLAPVSRRHLSGSTAKKAE
jgi:hypothetical protein